MEVEAPFLSNIALCNNFHQMTEGRYLWFEKSLKAMEAVLGVGITVTDHRGLFHTPAGEIIFPAPRQSHQKFPVCRAGFSERCVAFCRHEMNRVCAQREGAFSKCCWKGVVEMVVPLRWKDEYWGLCTFGPWRSADAQTVEEVPPEFWEHYQALPVWSEDRLEALSALLEAFTRGLVASLAEVNAVSAPPPDRRAEVMGYFRRHAASAEASLEGLAQALRLSRSRTSRLLQGVCGGSFTTLLHRVRIQRARVLLLSTPDKLAAIAEATGFADEYHFSKVFRKTTGMPPGAFRRMHQSRASETE